MSKTKRTAILSIALLFLVTSLAFSIMVVIELTKDKPEPTNDISSIIEQQADKQTNKKENTVLQGTKLENYEPRDNVAELEIIDIKEGDGAVVHEAATVTAHYTGALANNGTIFQSSYDSGSPIPFSLNGVIQGWTEGVPGMKVGGTRRLIIPAEKAYGAQSPSPDIPANADLVFDITLISVEQ